MRQWVGCMGVLACLCAAAGEPRLKIAYATYLGGDGWDQAREIIVYPDGSILVGAQTCSTTMPTTPGALQPKFGGGTGDAFIVKLVPAR